jgi:mono/diheme cytochrome c family protein
VAVEFTASKGGIAVKSLFVLAGLAFVCLVVMTAAAAEEAMPAGQEVFLDVKCNMCHAVSTAGVEAKTTSEKMRGPDLVGLAEDDTLGDAGALAEYIKQESEIDGAKHKKGFKGTDEELQALIDWLLEQKAD